jgi:hypothetical protein
MIDPILSKSNQPGIRDRFRAAGPMTAPTDTTRH